MSGVYSFMDVAATITGVGGLGVNLGYGATVAEELLSCLSGSELEYTRTNALIFKENKAVLVCHPYFGRGG